ncbi:ALQxL family class IV lanthipeptide [Streptomyces sp. NBC_00669]|nr:MULTISPECIES: ALQxL family class IV lanthipeptide [unclassified Streptomyces]
MDIDIDALQALPAEQEPTTQMLCTVTCGYGQTCGGETCTSTN